MISMIVHISNEEPIVGEVDAMPDATTNLIILKNPRRKDGQDIHFLVEDVTTVIIPLHRITIIQLMPSATSDDIIGFARD